ncbi:hypothetical protein PISL3812_07873 [Talaromyces islandicus]|uniref:DUF7587 domain-containing protein n=1 Tax=Talaromyces islandicus TaxID=28573 RepID=A0A0U1M5M8_TALIS|nr:hypothetical protein PISL3812_07873 [Talaromyces islandicus]
MFSNGDGFQAHGHYLMDLSHWLNKGKIERHLNWSDRSTEPTPFISVFDNYGDAIGRAKFLANKGYRDVFIACIDSHSLRPTTISIAFADERVVELLAWESDDGTTFISMQAIGQCFGIFGVQQSEWLVLDLIPPAMITCYQQVKA